MYILGLKKVDAKHQLFLNLFYTHYFRTMLKLKTPKLNMLWSFL